eukprot:123751-Hanusia_phi.AAC.1
MYIASNSLQAKRLVRSRLEAAAGGARCWTGGAATARALRFPQRVSRSMSGGGRAASWQGMRSSRRPACRRRAAPQGEGGGRARKAKEGRGKARGSGRRRSQ